MAAGRYVVLMGLEVTDDASYARYRAGMTPILQALGGSFLYDFAVAKVLKGDARINRVFAISYPDRATRARLYEDERYRAVRKQFFEPAVASTTLLAEFSQ
jgi:uncharacterized protein (DUF1330 family)